MASASYTENARATSSSLGSLSAGSDASWPGLALPDAPLDALHIYEGPKAGHVNLNVCWLLTPHQCCLL